MKRALLAVAVALLAVGSAYAGPKHEHTYTGTVVRCGTSSFYQTAMPACEVAFERRSDSLDSDSKEDIVMIVSTISFHSIWNNTLQFPHTGKTPFVVGEKVTIIPYAGQWRDSMVTSIYYALRTKYTENGKEKEEIHVGKMKGH